ncbi:MAG: IclR family transcriptional regulator [Burkholderiales bacterium]|nr:IclR family transcriptional regulator [Burkholderiales bacterium]
MRSPKDALESRDPGFLDIEVLQQQPQFASTLANGLAVLGCFGQGDALLGNKELSERLGIARPTITRLTYTLMGLGYLRRDKSSGKYALGAAVLSLGYPLLSQMAIRQVAGPEMLELACLANGPVSMGMRDRLQLVYVETVVGNESNFTKPGIGSTRPLLRTAMGRALLYGHSQQERSYIYDGLKSVHQEDYQSYLAPTERAFKQLKTNGFCTVIGEWQPTLAAVAVPLSVRYNGVPLAFNLTVATYEMDETVLTKKFAPRLMNLVRGVERSLGLS